MSEYDELVTGGQPLGGNEYDVLLFEEQKQNRQRLRASVNGALKANPDQTAKARQLAQTTGVPAPVVERNLRDVEHRARVNEYDALLEKSPAVARKLQDPDFAKLAHDDVGVLTQVERAVKAGLAGAAQATLNLAESIFRTPEAVGRISKAGEQAAGLPWWSNPLGQLDDAMRLLSGAGAASPTNVADKIGEAQKILAENPDTFGETFQRLAQKGQAADAAFQSGLKGDFSPILDIVTDPEAWAGFIGQAAPSLAMAWQSGGSLPFLAWLEGLDAAGTAAEFEQRTGQKISDADFAQAVAQAASINAVLEKTGLGQVIGGAARGTLPGFMRGTLGEGTTEALQQFNTNLAAFLSYNPEQTLSEGVLGSVMGGAGVGGPAGALASVAARVQEKQQQDVQRVQKAQGDAAALDETVKAAAGSKLLARAPDAFRDAVDVMLGDEAPDVHIGAQDAQAFFQSRPEIIETVRQLMPEVAQSITDALATGADVVVPKADYITYFGQYHQELREVLRNGLDGMTLREAAEWQTTQGEQFRAEAEKALEEHVADSAFQGDAQQVYDNVLGQLNNAARFTEDVNKAYATLARDFYVTQGNRLRMSPSEVYQKYPLRIQAENVAGPQLEQNATVVDTPEFKNWFGDSKVVDEQGRPLVVYHGTKTDFEQYDPKKAGASDDGLAGKAFYFTYNPEEASSYAERETFGAGDAPNVQPVYISLRNPFVITQGVLPDGRTLKELHGGIGVNAKGGAALRKLAADGGHDGVIWVSRDGSVRHVAAFHPEQIKSAIGNRGAFDPNDPNILNQFAGINAQTADKHALATAQKLLAEGRGAESVRQETGWSKGVDDKWRYEISDDKAKLKAPWQSEGQRFGDIYVRVLNPPDALKLGDILDHPALFAAYPALAYIRIEVKQGSGASLIRPQGGSPTRIQVGADESSQVLSILLHEVQHAIQEQEGFASGGDPQQMAVVYSRALQEWDFYSNVAQLVKEANDNHGGNLDKAAEVIREAGLDAAQEHIDAAMRLGEKRVMAEAEKSEATLKKLRSPFAPKYGDVGVALYRRLAGEAEARNTQLRQRMTDAERLEHAPESTADTPAPDVIVMFNGHEMQSAPPPANTLRQSARGAFSPETNTITLLKNADLSTFLHELGHFFLEVQTGIAAQPDAPPQVRADMDAVLKWFGVENLPEVSALERWQGMTLDEKRPYHEQFARGFEAYLFEGQAPSLELRSMFQRFRAWLTRVYASLQSLNVTLTDEVRSVMDRMLATDAQVKAAQDARRYLPLFASPEDAGMTPEEFAEYQALGSEATAEATEELQRRSLKDMQWLSNAKSKVLRELQRRAGALRRETRMEVAREVWGQPVYRAWQFLTSDAPPEAKPKANPNIDPTRDSIFVAIAKLGGIDRDAARREWGVDPAARPAGVFGKPVLRAKGGKLPGEMEELLTQFGYFTLDAHGRPVLHALEEAFHDELGGVKRYSAQADYDFLLADAPGAQDILAHMGGRLNTANAEALLGEGADLERLRRRRMLRKDGLDPEIVAEAFGFGSGDELVRALVEADTPKVTIEALTDQRMLERHGDLYDERSRARAADEAVHNSTRIRFVATELRALAKATGQRMVLVSAAKDYAEQAIARKKVAQIKPAQYAASEARSARDAEKALRSGNTAEAAAHKRTQLLNGYMYKAAAEGISEAEKAVAYLKRFDKDSIRKNLDPDYRDQIDTLLERFDLRKGTSLKDIARRKSLAEWIESQRAQGFEPVLDERLVNDAIRTSYKELSLEQLRGLRDTVKNIEHLGKLKKILLTAAERREFDAAVAEAERSIRDNANRKVEDRIERNTWLDRAREGKDEFFAMHRKLASMAREMDGGQDNGVMWDLFIRPANECGVKEAVEREKATMALTQLFKPIAKGGSLRAKRVVPGTNISLSREGRLMVALNWGNADNRKRLLEGGDGWTPADVQAILDTLTREDWGFVQGVWDFIDSYWPQIAEKERRVSGLTPEKVQPIAVQTQYGEYRGGYFPIKYDPLRSSRAEADSMAEVVKQAMQGLYTRATTRRGHTKARAESVTDRPLRKDFGVIFEHVDQVAHDLAWHEYLIDANRLLRATAIDRAIRDHYGPQTLRAIRKTLDDIAAGDIPAQNAFERSINHLRNGTSIAGMGWNLGTALLQPLGLTQSMVRIGPKWVARGLAAWVGDAARMENTVARIYEKSNFMRLRGKTMQREISEIRNRVTAGGKLAPVKETYFWLIQKAQMIADVPTWLGAYEKAVAKGEHEARAVELADQAVLDAQGGGQIKDLAHIQRGGPLLKLWTNFYSYFNVTYNLTAESYRRTNFRHPLEVGRFAVDMFLLYTAPALLAAAMQEAIKNDCDGDEECLARKLAGAQASYMLGTVVGLREVGSVVQGYYGYSGPAGTRFFSEIGKVVQQSEQGEVDAALLKSINSSAGILFHYPSGQVQRTVEGVASVAGGDIEGPRALIAPVFGPPKNP